jgi:hypothetical protein
MKERKRRPRAKRVYFAILLALTIAVGPASLASARPIPDKCSVMICPLPR